MPLVKTSTCDSERKTDKIEKKDEMQFIVILQIELKFQNLLNY
jgi:hypothetical protein